MIIRCMFWFFVVTSAQSQEHSSCTKLGSAYESMCPRQAETTVRLSRQGFPGKKGAKGDKGENGVRGIKGEKGNGGEPSYARVEDIVSQRMQEVLAEHSRKYTELANLLTAANEKIRHLENKTDYCPMRYQGKCFWVEVRHDPKITFEQGSDICASQGGKPANIYSEDHYYMMIGMLRMFSSKDWGLHAWLGMTYDVKTLSVFLSNGTRANFVKWHPGHPDGRCCTVNLKARKDGSDQHQHMWTGLATYKIRAIMCEK